MTHFRKSCLITAPLALALALALTLVAPPALAQSGAGEGNVSGGFHIGYRSVDVSGDSNKYQEDVNLEDGPRLFDFSLHYVPAAGNDNALDGLVDRVDLTADGLGGDPYESLHLNVQRYDRFKLRYTRTSSDYFYQDAFGLDPHDGDFHSWDLRRVRDRANLSVNMTDRATLTFGLNRYTRKGDSVTTLDISREEFELDRPVDESLNDSRIGFQYEWDKVTLLVEERLREFDNDVLTFIPGASTGFEPGPASLDFFFYAQPYELESQETRVTVVAKPTDRWLIRAAGSMQDYDSDIALSQDAQGVDFRGNPLDVDASGRAKVEGDITMFDLDATYFLSERVALVGSVYSRDREQDGGLVFGEGGAPDVIGDSVWDITQTGVEAGMQWQATSALELGAGLRWEEREVDHGAVEGDDPLELHGQTTEQNGGYVTAGFRPGNGFTLTAEADLGSIDDPFVLTAPTDRLRYRLRAEKRLAGGWSLVGSYVGHDTENNDSGFDSTYDLANLRVAYTTPTLDLALGYGFIDIQRSIDQEMSFGDVFLIDYDAESDFIDARLRWRPVTDWDLGASVLLYENEGDGPGGYNVTRDNLRAYAERWFQDWSLKLAYRNVDFEEQSFGFETYDADVVEAAIGYRW